MNSTGTAYGARGSVSSVETPSADSAVSGIDPVRMTVKRATASRARPKLREK